jgi:hypothetical protein
MLSVWLVSSRCTSWVRPIIEELRLRKGKSAILWSGMEWFPDGLYLPWKTPATFRAGYFWFARVGVQQVMMFMLVVRHTLCLMGCLTAIGFPLHNPSEVAGSSFGMVFSRQ